MTVFAESVLDRLRQTRIVAGLAVTRVEDAVPAAEALLAGGVEAVELTLRTSEAMAAVEAIARQVPGMLLGVGTVLTPEQARQVRDAGAAFGVAPGMNPSVMAAAQDVGLPFAPGIATPSELELAIERGCRFVKFFPAEGLGGVPYLKSMAAPYKHLGIEYFPLGGLNTQNMGQYLQQSDIPAIGGSWIASGALIAAGDWAGITARAAEAREQANALLAT